MRQRILAWGPDQISDRVARANEVCERRFRFLNVEREFQSIPWRGTPVGALWSFNLQYFDYAVDLAWAFHETKDSRYLRITEALLTDWEAVSI